MPDSQLILAFCCPGADFSSSSKPHFVSSSAHSNPPVPELSATIVIQSNHHVDMKFANKTNGYAHLYTTDNPPVLIQEPYGYLFQPNKNTLITAGGTCSNLPGLKPGMTVRLCSQSQPTLCSAAVTITGSDCNPTSSASSAAPSSSSAASICTQFTTGKIMLPNAPDEPAYLSANGKTVLAQALGNLAMAPVSVIDAATHTASTVFLPYASMVEWIALSSDGKQAFVTIAGQKDIVVLDASTAAIITTLNLSTVPHGPFVIGNRLFVPTLGISYVSVIDTTSFATVGSLSVPLNDFGSAYAEPGIEALSDLLITYDRQSNTTTLLDPVTLQPKGTIPLALFHAFVSGSKIYQQNSGSVTVVDLQTLKVTKTIPAPSCTLPGTSTGSDAVTYGNKAFIPCPGSNAVAVIDNTTDTLVKTIALGKNPTSIVKSGSLAYVGSFSDGTVSIIDMPSATLVTTIVAGGSGLSNVVVAGNEVFAVSPQNANAFYINTQSCRESSSSSLFPLPPPIKPVTDAHGCLLDGGYTWCASQQKCLRPWEEKCNPTDCRNISDCPGSTCDINTYTCSTATSSAHLPPCPPGSMWNGTTCSGTDAHGCHFDGGYFWCESQQTCLPPSQQCTSAAKSSVPKSSAPAAPLTLSATVSITNGQSVHLSYAKTTPGCAHLYTTDNPPLQIQDLNMFCSYGGSIAGPCPWIPGLKAGMQVRLCDENHTNVCSNTVTVTGNGQCLPASSAASSSSSKSSAPASSASSAAAKSTAAVVSSSSRHSSVASSKRSSSVAQTATDMTLSAITINHCQAVFSYSQPIRKCAQLLTSDGKQLLKISLCPQTAAYTVPRSMTTSLFVPGVSAKLCDKANPSHCTGLQKVTGMWTCP